jgi:hypothetical protein
MTKRDWLSFHFAANEIEQRLGVSGGMAMRMLRDACASGDVRSQRQPYNPATGIDEGPHEPIKPSDWTNTQLDLECDADGCRYFVDVDEDDFRYWLDKQGSPQKLKLGPPSRKRALARQAIEQIWPSDIPKDVPNPQILREVGAWLDNYWKREKLQKLDISPDTILRAARRKN